VYYPKTFQGTWTTHRTILSSANSSTGKARGSGIALEYSVRFLPSVQEDAVVADRGFNQANLEAAAAVAEANIDGINSDNGTTIQSCEWTETNPNDLKLIFRDGSRKDVKVTKRATERTDSTVFSSEFQRVVVTKAAQDSRTEASGRLQTSVPAISARRVLSKWKVIDDNHIEGLELVYDADIGGLGDPLLTQLAQWQQQKDQSTLLLKSRLVLERRRQP